MLRIERWVYDRVKNRPVLKQRIVDAYQAFLGLLPQAAIETPLRPVVREGYFFGFHDKTPFSPDGEQLLAHRNLIGDRTVRHGDPVEVGVFTGPEWEEFSLLGRTTAWNWQLGSMLQWVGRTECHVAFNDLEGSRPIGRLVDLGGSTLERWTYPVVHVSPTGTHASSYDFHRVEAGLAGYGVVPSQSVPHHDPENAFVVFACASGSPTFRLTLAEAAAISPQASMSDAFHFFHHSLFCPDGSRLFFLHRWIDGNARLWTRMFSVGPDGSGLYLFPMDEMVSHVTWASTSEVFGYLRYPGRSDGYYLVEDQTGSATRFFGEVLNSDGHPTMDRGRNIVITDTYPDRFRNQYLVMCRPDTERRVDLCRTHLPKRFARELQVDLHPRLHPNRDVVCFDSGHTGTRSLVTMDFGSLR